MRNEHPATTALIILCGMVCGFVVAIPASFCVFRILSNGRADLTMLFIPGFSSAAIAAFYVTARIRGVTFLKTVLIPFVVWVFIFELVLYGLTFETVNLFGYAFYGAVISVFYWVFAVSWRSLRTLAYKSPDEDPIADD